MLVLLPPSEGKTAPRRGRPVDLDALAFADELGEQRAAVLRALTALAGGPLDVALGALGLSEGQAGEVGRDARLLNAPAARASAVYTGVLFERLGLAALPLRARRRVVVFSALWGVVRPDDRIPAYKLAMGAKLPGFRGLAATWKPALRAALPDDGLVLDLRSGAYAAAWTPKDAEVVTVRAFSEHAGERTVVSHMVKATRGDVARLALSAPRPPRSAGDVAELVAAAGHRVELTPARGGPALDVIA